MKNPGVSIGQDYTYDLIVRHVANGKTLDWLLANKQFMSKPRLYIEEKYAQAVQEIWEHRGMLESKIGRLLYD